MATYSSTASKALTTAIFEIWRSESNAIRLAPNSNNIDNNQSIDNNWHIKMARISFALLVLLLTSTHVHKHRLTYTDAMHMMSLRSSSYSEIGEAKSYSHHTKSELKPIIVNAYFESMLN